MKVVNKIEIIGDSGDIEADLVATVYKLDAKEAHDTAVDLVKGVTAALSGFNPETGDALK